MKLICLLAVARAAAASAASLHGGEPDVLAPPTPLERLGRETNIAAMRASASSSDARSAADEMEARLNAEGSAQSKRAAQTVASEISLRSVTIQGAAIEAQKAQIGAAAAAASSAAAVATAKAGLQQAAAIASAHVSAEVDNALTNVYMGLQEWKMKVLHDPVKEATVAGMKAALPFERALQTIEKRVAAYEQRATGLSNQARSLRTLAVGLADGAVSKQAKGALADAQKDMTQAHTMMSQAAAFEGEGLRLIKEAQKWNIQIPSYQGAAASAAHEKTYQYAKKSFAPPPISFGLPPPTDNVFLQKSATSRARED